MADIKISQLGAAIAVNDGDLLPIVSNGNTLKAPASLVKDYAVGNADLSGIGDGTPTGAIAALNTDKQPKTLVTAITVDGTQQTTVEGALGAINTDLGSTKQALTNVKNGTSDINQTAADGCTIVNGITKGTYFYLDGVLVKAKTSISNGDSFTSSNYEVPTAGALNELISSFTSRIPTITSDANAPLALGLRTFSVHQYTSTTSNAPSGGTGLLITWSSAERYGCQIALNDSHIFFRVKSDSATPSAWTTVV